MNNFGCRVKILIPLRICPAKLDGFAKVRLRNLVAAGFLRRPQKEKGNSRNTVALFALSW